MNDDLLRLAGGDRSAFDPLFHALWLPVRRLTERALGGTGDADDAAQAALLKVFERASAFDGERDAVSWIFGIARHECMTVRKRRARRREEGDGALDRLAAAGDPEERLLERDLEVALHEVIGTLRDEDRQTLVTLLDGRRPDVPAPTFRKRVERATGRLRTAWMSRSPTRAPTLAA